MFPLFPGCKERWESLRSQFRKIMAKCTKSEQGASTTVKWKYEEQMGFLRSLSKDRTRICSTPAKEVDMYETPVDEIEEVDDISEGYDVQDSEKSPIDTIAGKPATSDTACPKPRPRKRKQQATSSASAQLMSYILENKQSTSSDSLDTFFQAMLSTVKKFNSNDQLMVKKKIFEIVTDVEGRYISQQHTPSVSPTLSWNSSIENTTFMAQGNLNAESSCCTPHSVSPATASTSSDSNGAFVQHDSAVSGNLSSFFSM